MSRRLISRSPDLRLLLEEGYAIEVRAGHLLVHDVPYVNSEAKVKTGTVVSALTLAGEVADKPGDHTVWFIGEAPCDEQGNPLHKIINNSEEVQLAEGLKANHYFSSKPVGTGAYPNYFEKMTAYINIVSTPAQKIDPEATPLTGRVVAGTDPDSVFEYEDTASSRSQITAITEKLKTSRVAIVGLGGTGSYILDFIAKTPVAEIHLYDGDDFLTHNAFRGPGAASLDELNQRPLKVSYWRDRYVKVHRKIYAHEDAAGEGNVGELANMTFVFLAMDRGTAWRLLVGRLQECGIPFVDVGMGLYEANGSLGGQVRTTTSTPARPLELPAVAGRVDAAVGENANEYDQNIQIAELNALNAAMAVIKWKKTLGFYLDFDGEHNSIYTIDGNTISNEDQTA